jgi:hypothetical protein
MCCFNYCHHTHVLVCCTAFLGTHGLKVIKDSLEPRTKKDLKHECTTSFAGGYYQKAILISILIMQ